MYRIFILLSLFVFLSGIFISKVYSKGINQFFYPTSLTSPVQYSTNNKTVVYEKRIEQPKLLSIPKIGINAEIEVVGLDNEKKMDIPKNVGNVAWYKYGSKPGEKGNSVIAGHLDSTTGPAIFYNLHKLSVNDSIIVTDQADNKYIYNVKEVKSYPYNEFPIDLVFGYSDDTRLNLITCGGNYNLATGKYDERIVVYSEISQ